MKMKEFIESTKEAGIDSFYAEHIINLYFDVNDAIEEGCIEGIVASRPTNGILTVTCSDGTVKVYGEDGVLKFREIKRKPVQKTYLSPYERTRAMVYATGNKWAIENFNATH